MNLFRVIGNVTLASVLTVALALPVAFGQSGVSSAAPPDRSAGATATPDLFERLNLSAAQKQKIESLRDSAAPRMRALEQQIRAKHRELQAAFQNGRFDQSLATEKLREMAPIQAQLMGEEYRLHNQVLANLTPQQKSQLQKFEEQARQESSEPQPGQ